MAIFTTYFTNAQIILLVVSALAFLSSLLFHVNGKENISVGFLMLTATSVFCFSALLDPFLNLWDERFHALVGKNLMNHLLMPTLYDDPVVNMAYDKWDKYHIWLHKQPLFLWQIALSFKLFGISEFTLRLPDIILGVVLVFIGYRCGKLLVSKRVGYLTGVLIVSTIYILELIAGRQELDHNDFTFLVYISLSLWSFIEYSFSKKRIWIYLIGLFSGMAILCKWLVGLLVYFGWIVLRLQQKKYKFSENKDLLISLAITLLIALPWQILTFIWYPAETVSAYRFNTSHFLKTLEGHSGTLWYYLENFNTIYGELASFLIIPAFYFMLRNSKQKQLFYTLLIMVLLVYLFFSLAATKMPSFPIIVSMIIFIAFASLFAFVLDYLEQLNIKKWIFKLFFVSLVVIVVLLRFDIEFLQERHTSWKTDNSYTRMLSENKKIFNGLKLPGNTVLFNVKGRHYIEAMFYTGFPAYNFIPSKEQCIHLKEKGKTIALFKLINTELPDYLKNDSTLIIINNELQGYE